MSEQTELKKALITVQYLYKKKTKKKECVDFYVKYIQPIYDVFEANEKSTS